MPAPPPTTRPSPAGSPASTDTGFPPRFGFAGTLRQELRYGENPHQRAAFYVTDKRPGVATATQVQGKELSYNNLNDTDAAFECVAEFDAPTVAIIKHASPCGVASAATLSRSLGPGLPLRSGFARSAASSR